MQNRTWAWHKHVDKRKAENLSCALALDLKVARACLAHKWAVGQFWQLLAIVDLSAL